MSASTTPEYSELLAELQTLRTRLDALDARLGPDEPPDEPYARPPEECSSELNARNFAELVARVTEIEDGNLAIAAILAEPHGSEINLDVAASYVSRHEAKSEST